MKRALITGISGQDGSYLTEFLLDRGYEVHGLVRRSSSVIRSRLEHLPAERIASGQLQLHYGDLDDQMSLVRLLTAIEPDEVYNLAAQSHVQVSFEVPVYTGAVTAIGTLSLLEAIRVTGLEARFYQASSSEMFGSSPPPQNESTRFHPRSPYAFAKVYAYWATVNYREAYDMFAVNGILFNHESPRRGENFVTRKITRGVADIVHGRKTTLGLGNLEARRDWGFAGDYVEAMWMMMQQSSPDDFVIATGQQYSVAQFCEAAFRCVDLDYRDYVVEDKRYFRPAEVETLCGDASKAAVELGWKPHTSFDELVTMMVSSDVERQVN